MMEMKREKERPILPHEPNTVSVWDAEIRPQIIQRLHIMAFSPEKNKKEKGKKRRERIRPTEEKEKKKRTRMS
jgi:hypothetical protein